MLVAPLQAKELATFSLTSLERAPVRHLSLQPDLGIPLSYLDMGVYAVPSHPQALAPEDAALVQVYHKHTLVGMLTNMWSVHSKHGTRYCNYDIMLRLTRA